MIDFSLADATLPMAKIASKAGKPMVIGTTGHEKSVKQEIIETMKSIPVVGQVISQLVSISSFI